MPLNLVLHYHHEMFQILRLRNADGHDDLGIGSCRLHLVMLCIVAFHTTSAGELSQILRLSRSAQEFGHYP